MKPRRAKISLDPLEINCQKNALKAEFNHVQRSMNINKTTKNVRLQRASLSTMNSQNNKKNYEHMPSNGKYSIKQNSKIKTVDLRINARNIIAKEQSHQNAENEECLDRFHLLQIKPHLKPNVLKEVNRKSVNPSHPMPKVLNFNKALGQKVRRKSTLENICNNKGISTIAYREHNKIGQGLSHQALFMRKQSHLNAYYNIRKNKLIDITKENKKIYVRINSQKSLYSSRQLNKSYQSNCSLSRRLSQSKISRNSLNSSRSKITGRVSFNNNVHNNHTRKKQVIIFQSHDINHIQNQEMKKYANIFGNKQRKTMEKQKQVLKVQSYKRSRNSLSQRIREAVSEENEIHIKLKKQEIVQQEKENALMSKLDAKGLQKIIEQNLNGKRCLVLRSNNKIA